MQPPTTPSTLTHAATLDGVGCGDHDVPFPFGHGPCTRQRLTVAEAKEHLP
jgi:hypothetical protein